MGTDLDLLRMSPRLIAQHVRWSNENMHHAMYADREAEAIEMMPNVDIDWANPNDSDFTALHIW